MCVCPSMQYVPTISFKRFVERDEQAMFQQLFRQTREPG
jgi:hypothetical protein